MTARKLKQPASFISLDATTQTGFQEKLPESAELPLDMQTFEDINYEQLTLYAAESGADRELDYEWDRFVDRQYSIFEDAMRSGKNTIYSNTPEVSGVGLAM